MMIMVGFKERKITLVFREEFLWNIPSPSLKRLIQLRSDQWYYGLVLKVWERKIACFSHQAKLYRKTCEKIFWRLNPSCLNWKSHSQW